MTPPHGRFNEINDPMTVLLKTHDSLPMVGLLNPHDPISHGRFIEAP